VSSRRLTWVIAFLIISASLCAARDLAVLSNKSNAISGLTQADLVKLSKGEMSRWPDGKPVTFILRPPSTPEMKVLVEKIYEVPAAQVSELISAANHGRANHPAIIIADSDEDLVNKVASLPGAVGVVDVYAINSSVTVIKVGGKLPLEPGYLLHGN
jgi:ABC-type phosphate transport system substrate-binding protein